MRLRSGLFLALLLVAGCAAQHGRAYVDPGYVHASIRTIAVLPPINRSNVQTSLEPVNASMVAQLQIDKHYAVTSTAAVLARLRSGDGAMAFSQIMNAVNLEEEPDNALFDQLTQALNVDALMMENVQEFYQTQREGIGAYSGGTAAQMFPTTVVHVSGALYSTHAHTIVWRNDYLETYAADPYGEGRNSWASAIAGATRGLLATLPINTWAPFAPPAPTPLPSPVTSLAPIPYPVDISPQP